MKTYVNYTIDPERAKKFNEVATSTNANRSRVIEILIVIRQNLPDNFP